MILEIVKFVNLFILRWSMNLSIVFVTILESMLLSVNIEDKIDYFSLVDVQNITALPIATSFVLILYFMMSANSYARFRKDERYSEMFMIFQAAMIFNVVAFTIAYLIFGFVYALIYVVLIIIFFLLFMLLSTDAKRFFVLMGVKYLFFINNYKSLKSILKLWRKEDEN